MQVAIIHWKGCLLRAIEQRMKTNIRAACVKLERQILTRLFNWLRKSFAPVAIVFHFSLERKKFEWFRPTSKRSSLDISETDGKFNEKLAIFDLYTFMDG